LEDEAGLREEEGGPNFRSAGKFFT